MNNLKIAVIDDVKNLPLLERLEYLNLRHTWLKKVRKEDLKEIKKEYQKEWEFLKRKKLREENPIYCKTCNKLIIGRKRKYCDEKCTNRSRNKSKSQIEAHRRYYLKNREKIIKRVMEYYYKKRKNDRRM